MDFHCGLCLLRCHAITITDTKCGWVSGVNLLLIYILDWLVMMMRKSVLFGNFDLIYDVLDAKYKLNFYCYLARSIHIQRLNCDIM